MKIEFDWWNLDNKNDTIPQEHQEKLNENAIERINEMINKGFTSGELIDEIESKNAIYYYGGWWSYTKPINQIK